MSETLVGYDGRNVCELRKVKMSERLRRPEILGGLGGHNFYRSDGSANLGSY
jgi:hypothetical protein